MTSGQDPLGKTRLDPRDDLRSGPSGKDKIGSDGPTRKEGGDPRDVLRTGPTGKDKIGSDGPTRK
jgi:hypothetical protein